MTEVPNASLFAVKSTGRRNGTYSIHARILRHLVRLAFVLICHSLTQIRRQINMFFVFTVCELLSKFHMFIVVLKMYYMSITVNFVTDFVIIGLP